MIDLEMHKLDDIISGYSFNQQNNTYTCIACGAVFEKGEVFKVGERFFDAVRAIRMHIATEHINRFSELLFSDNKYLALTDNQKALFQLFRDGLPDSEIAAKLNVSPSTVRHQKFMFRERAKSAKMYLAIWEMVSSDFEKNKNSGSDELLPVHEGAKMIDERYEITEEESKKIINNVFESLEPLKLKVFSSKEKKKIVILRRISQQFEKGRRYTEKEVNSILRDIYEDFATMRRYLVEYGYMDRTKDGHEYWLK